MKKILLIVCLTFILSGCTMNQINNAPIDALASYALSGDNTIYNTNEKGYRYYLPRGFKVKSKSNNNNSILINENKEFYLYVDTVGYFNKVALDYSDKNSSYYYLPINNNGKLGYINITQKNDKFLLEIMYNYAIIEVMVKNEDISSSVIDGLVILSSIKYNDLVIKNLIDEEIANSGAVEEYKIFGPKDKKDSNFLEIYNKYDTYEE